MLIPGVSLLRITAAWMLLGLAASFHEPLALIWKWGTVFTIAAAVVDAVLLFCVQKVRISRKLPARLALGVAHEVEITATNPGRLPAPVRLMDGLPPELTSADWPWSGTLAPRGYAAIAARVKPIERGEQTIAPAWVEHLSPWRLWSRRYRAGEPGVTRVFPDYEPVIRYALLGVQHRASQMGIRRHIRPGQSRDFRQLRDFMDGDALNTIDWKATSRRHTLTSREFEEQRNQTVILMADCGRRLRAMDGDLSQFDHTLNAMLLISDIALRQGDRLGVLGWGEETRWLPPQSGTSAMPSILEHLYHYHPGTTPGDIGEAVTQLQARQPRRALVIVFTNLRSEDHTHLLAPLRLLRRKHLVILATLREAEVSTRMEQPISTMARAEGFAATAAYVEDRKLLLSALHAEGILTLDVPARELPAALGNAYLDIKQQGLL